MGGKVIPNARPVLKDQVDTVIQSIKAAMPCGIAAFIIGSAGKKPVSSDIDVLVDETDVITILSNDNAKHALHQYFTNLGLTSVISGAGVHVGVKVLDSVVQVDFMCVKNAREIANLHTHDYSKDPTQTGGQIHRMLADLISAAPGFPNRTLMISPYKGLVFRDTKELITTDKSKIAQILFGPLATEQDISSVSAIKNQISLTPHYTDIYKKYFYD